MISRIPRWLITAVAGLVLAANGGVFARAAENVWSIDYLNSRKSEWDQLMGATVRLEGRISLHGGGKMRLAKCDLAFHVKESQLRALNGKRTVEFSGEFKRDNGKLIFEVEQIRPAPTDVDQYESRSAKLRNPRPDDWYELGDWASGRSRFYDDAELAEKAESAYTHGIAAERRLMSADDAGARFALARKIGQYKLSDDQRLELMHEGDRLLWQAALKSEVTSRDDWKRLASRLAEDLPGCTQPLVSFPDELKQSYEQRPLATYRESTDVVRRQLHRIFYADVVLKPILDEAAADGRNGDTIAEQIEWQVPEATAVAEKHRGLKLNWRLARVATATRPEVEQLAEEFRTRKQPGQAQQALSEWLRSRESRLREDGPLGLLQLADEHLALLRDEARAVALLKEAYKLDPTFTDIGDRLKSLGYILERNDWIKSSLVKPNTDPTPDHMNVAGGIAVGMTSQALQSLMGRPKTISRAVTSAGVAEVWCYGAPGTSRLIVQLLQSDSAADAKVVAFGNGR